MLMEEILKSISINLFMKKLSKSHCTFDLKKVQWSGFSLSSNSVNYLVKKNPYLLDIRVEFPYSQKPRNYTTHSRFNAFQNSTAHLRPGLLHVLLRLTRIQHALLRLTRIQHKCYYA